MGLALSTSWNASSHNDASSMLFEIKELGFRDIELSFNLDSAMVSQVQAAFKDLGLNIISLHNFCPTPEGVEREKALPDYFSLASPENEERLNAVKYTKRTIDNAKRLGAKAVVLHCGKVEVSDKTRDLISLYENGLKETREFRQLKSTALKERQEVSGKFFDHTLVSLDELNGYANCTGIFLGIETRFYLREIPDLEETSIILEKFKGSNIFYWHDTGHARVLENLGLYEAGEFLDLYAESMIGVHLHDVSGCSDHKAPSKGELDFSHLKPYLKKETLKVIEAHPPAGAQDIKQAKSFLEKLLNGSN